MALLVKDNSTYIIGFSLYGYPLLKPIKHNNTANRFHNEGHYVVYSH